MLEKCCQYSVQCVIMMKSTKGRKILALCLAFSMGIFPLALKMAVVFINPKNGKLVDISYFNYFYEKASEENKIICTRPNIMYTERYYPYHDNKYLK